MKFEEAFSESEIYQNLIASKVNIQDFEELKSYLDMVHIKHCLLAPFFEHSDYPTVDLRDLMPSFDADPLEYVELPSFSLVVFPRRLESFKEIFQYDFLYPSTAGNEAIQGPVSLLEDHVISRNMQNFMARLPRNLCSDFEENLHHLDLSDLANYEKLLPYIFEMDRAHVLSTACDGRFHMSGIYASFPSDPNGEVKRFGLKIGKFKIGDNSLYERNRLSVYNFLMELYGFSVVSERRTSAAMFARKLAQTGEHFLIRVLGQSDRTITTIWNDGEHKSLHVEKIALVKLDHDQSDLIQDLNDKGYLLDAKKRVAIAKIRYVQHGFRPVNVRQERALSISKQCVIHPVTGETLSDLALMRDTSSIILRLKDIIAGDFEGRIIYKRSEVIERTDTHDKKLKSIYSWLTKHQRRILGYNEENYAIVSKMLDTYLQNDSYKTEFSQSRALVNEVNSMYAYVNQARKVRFMEDLRSRKYKGEKISYALMYSEAADLLSHFKFEITEFYENLVQAMLFHAKAMLDDHYIHKKYISRQEDALKPNGIKLKRNYGKLVVEYDNLLAIYKSKQNKD